MFKEGIRIREEFPHHSLKKRKHHGVRMRGTAISTNVLATFRLTLVTPGACFGAVAIGVASCTPGAGNRRMACPATVTTKVGSCPLPIPAGPLLRAARVPRIAATRGIRDRRIRAVLDVKGLGDLICCRPLRLGRCSVLSLPRFFVSFRL